jgi:serine phosphatase RsbU (regulator of sigma subunit)/PAS domain-containing protein/anti-sigma regulatory factor (Ser/Thr protein kinase)
MYGKTHTGSWVLRRGDGSSGGVEKCNGVITVAVDEFVLVVDGNGVVVQWSRRAQKLVGCTAEEAVGRPVSHLVTQIAAGARGGPRPGDADLPLPGVDSHAVGDLRVRPMLCRDGAVEWAVFQAARDGATIADVQATAAQAWFAHAPAGLYVLDTELRIVSADLATQILGGGPGERVLGRRLTDVYRLDDPSEIEAALRDVLDSGVPVPPERVLRMSLQDVPGRACWAWFSAFRLEDARGAVLGVAAVLADAGEIEKKRARLRFFSELRARVGRTLDVVATCQDVVDALVPGGADIAVLEVVDSIIRGEDPPLAPVGRGVPLRRVAFRFRGDEPQIQAHPLGDVRPVPFPGPYAQVLTDLKPRVLDLGPDMPWLSADPARAEAIRASGARALLAVPLALRGAVFGLLCLYRTEQASSFEEIEVDLVLELAAETALSIDRARLYTREHTIAAAVQRGLLPARQCSQTGIETAHAQVFGDAGGGGWCDSFTVAGGRTALVVGEISGQGIQAAAAMAAMRTVVRSLARLDLEPDELIARLNDTAVLLANERAALPPGDPSHWERLTASCVYAIYDPLAGTCTYARAQHPPPAIVSRDGTAVEVPDVPAGPLLGTSDGAPFTAATVKLAVGSILALYTPSILPAAASGDPGDQGPLRRILADAGRPLQDLCDNVVYSLRDGPRPGDAVLVLARTRVFPPGQTGTWQFGLDPEAAGRARVQVRRKLAAWKVDEEAAQATELIVSELVTNAIRYGAPPMWLRIVKDFNISCEVHDGSSVAPRLRHPGTLDEFGRGLYIVGRLVQAWGTRYTSDGKTIWTEQALPPQPGAR